MADLIAHLVARAEQRQEPTSPDALYGYVPSISLGAIFITIFGITTLIHLVQLIISRRYWWMTCMVIAGVLEILGWAARLWAHYASRNFDAYVMQICCLIIAPTFISAALYWCAGLMMAHIAPQKSFLSATLFKILFIVADVVSLVVQAVGGGMAGSAVGTIHHQQVVDGSHIMLAGIVIQLAVMVFYVIYVAVWVWRAKHEVMRAGRKIHLMLLAMLLSSIGVIVRGCYRTPELNEGFSGWIATQQIWQLFDAIPIAFASYVLNVIHPHWFLRYPAEVDVQLPFSEKPVYATQPAGVAPGRPASESTVADQEAPEAGNKEGKRDHNEIPVSTQV